MEDSVISSLEFISGMSRFSARMKKKVKQIVLGFYALGVNSRLLDESDPKIKGLRDLVPKCSVELEFGVWDWLDDTTEDLTADLVFLEYRDLLHFRSGLQFMLFELGGKSPDAKWLNFSRDFRRSIELDAFDYHLQTRMDRNAKISCELSETEVSILPSLLAHWWWQQIT